MYARRVIRGRWPFGPDFHTFPAFGRIRLLRPDIRLDASYLGIGDGHGYMLAP
jgi:hypothetical protein